jgi:hypothetical protein
MASLAAGARGLTMRRLPGKSEDAPHHGSHSDQGNVRRLSMFRIPIVLVSDSLCAKEAPRLS